jgi:hypothetical protein
MSCVPHADTAPVSMTLPGAGSAELPAVQVSTDAWQLENGTQCSALGKTVPYGTACKAPCKLD